MIYPMVPFLMTLTEQNRFYLPNESKKIIKKNRMTLNLDFKVTGLL